MRALVFELHKCTSHRDREQKACDQILTGPRRKNNRDVAKRVGCFRNVMLQDDHSDSVTFKAVKGMYF